ncbi:MAG TPA: hypothetical protein VKE91_02515, partial [Blastocatellia bacterium]|nr:hypothetical protein [Blastocatellia bacterium]
MITNLVGPPVRGTNFYGREAFANLASDKLKAGHVLLAAPRRFGKTSVMYRLMDNPQWDYRIVHADLEHLTDPASLIAELTEKLAINDFEALKLEPFAPKVAADFLNALAKSAKVPLSQPSKRKMLDVIGSPVPYFLQIIFSEVSKSHLLEGEAITPRKVELIYHQKVLGVDCKTYFDHYYGRLRSYYQ